MKAIWETYKLAIVIGVIIVAFFTAMILSASAPRRFHTNVEKPARAPAAAGAAAPAAVEPAAAEPATAQSPTAGAAASAPLGAEFGAAVLAVELLQLWVEAGAPETEPFDYTGVDGKTYQATYESDIHPLFTENAAWFEGSQACGGCHFGNVENSYHEMDLTTYEGMLKGGDVLSSPPGAPILGQTAGKTDFNWDHAMLRSRLRDNRMPPGWEFDITETNRDGPCLELTSAGVEIQKDGDKYQYGCDLNAVGVIAAWVEAGAPEKKTFEYGGEKLTFEGAVQPFFTQAEMWYPGSQACTSCHFGNVENSYHEMDLGTYQGILTGGDAVSSPPGVPILGQSAVGKTDYDWANSVLRKRLRNNRMPPGWEFDITEGNRDGPYVLHGKPVELEAEEEEVFGTGECKVKSVALLEAWVAAGLPENEPFDFTDDAGSACQGTYAADIAPLFAQAGAWFEGSPPCSSCHFGNVENSYHEMDLATHKGLLTGGDALSNPPGVPIFGQSAVGQTDYDWAASMMRSRLRDNRMPPGWEFDISETNRDGPCLEIASTGLEIQKDGDKYKYGCDLNAVGVIAAWVEAGAPEKKDFEYGGEKLTFERHVQPFFTQPEMWYPGSQACTACHFGNVENSYHEMDLGTYAGILKGGDVLSNPPGTPILGQSAVGKTDYDWANSMLRKRLRNNRMPPGWVFDITEENRDGPFVMAGTKK